MTTSKSKVRFERICRGVYATVDRRFFLETRGPAKWRLCERGELVGYKPSVQRTATADSPPWLRSDSVAAAQARAASKIADTEQEAE